MSSQCLPKCFTYLHNKGFVQFNQRIKELSTFGLTVRTNLLKCLSNYYQKVDKFTLFPVSGLQSIKHLDETFLKMKDLDKWAVYFDSLDQDEVISEPNNNIDLWSPLKPTKNLLIRCDPNQSLNLFYSFQNDRYREWRSLSGCPSHFTQSPISKCQSTNEQNVSIDFKSALSDQKRLSLENIKYLTDPDQIYNFLGFKTSHHIIWSKVYPDNATISYLIDGCQPSDEKDDEIKEMWFHEMLTPYHVALTIQSSSDPNLNTRLDNIADYLIKELKAHGVSVFPFKHRCLSITHNTYSPFDSIGIPYSITIREDSLQLGVVGLRNKDTKLEESVHLTRIKINLLLYLKLMKPLDVKLAIMEANNK